jgi:two-component system CheB/CheR fusion protein
MPIRYAYGSLVVLRAKSLIQIFATDISDKSVSKARSGIYDKKDMVGLSPEQIGKYFTKVNGSFQINKSIRDICVFASHNFLKDPPFAKMDLISCRNVLIYMEPFLQKRALTTFHYALKEHGYLFLGHSETTAPAAELFMPYGRSEKIYTRKSVPGRISQYAYDKSDVKLKENGHPLKNEVSRDDFSRSADEVVIKRFSPPGVVVNEEMEIVQVRGQTGDWLEPSPGKPSLNILKMVRQELAFELRNLLHKAKADYQSVLKEGIPLTSGSKRRQVAIEVVPLLNTLERYYLILFRDTQAGIEQVLAATPSGEVTGQSTADRERIIQLEREIAQLREDMRSITEDQEAVNEELQSANEELLSGTEELQSLNEELETSKEEIQSTNEELTTLNQELFDRNEQLNAARLYAESIVATIREPLLILDKDLKVRTANRAYYRKFVTREEETEGKSIYQIRNGQWDIPVFRSVIEHSLMAEGRISDVEIQHYFEDIGERILLLNASRLDRKENAELLILLAFEDVTDSRSRENDLLTFSRELETKVDERTQSLKESNGMLLQANEDLEQFATIASHDLQEPLRKIQTFSALLTERHGKDIEGEAAKLINKIHLAVQRMSELIYEVLRFSKVLDASKFEKVDLNRIVQNVKIDFDLLIEQKEAIITQDILPMIDAVPLQMNQLFYNLLGNALKFSKGDTAPRIHISYRPMPLQEVQQYPGLNSSLPYGEIIVSDNGIGFNQKFSEQVFLIFQRLNPVQHFEGTGIGLALCKRIILNHKGEIFVRSKEGEGSQFHIILPLTH